MIASKERGKKLRAERLSRGVSFDQVARSAKCRIKDVRALERGQEILGLSSNSPIFQDDQYIKLLDKIVEAEKKWDERIEKIKQGNFPKRSAEIEHLFFLMETGAGIHRRRR